MSRVVRLDITRAGNVFLFRVNDGSGHGASQQQFRSPVVQPAALQDLRQTIQAVARGSGDAHTLAGLGRLMFSTLLPQPVQAILRDSSASLLVSTDTPDIPIELFVDDKSGEPLGITRPVGRQLVTDHDVHPPAPPPASGGQPTFFLIGNPRNDLDGCDREVTAIAERLRGAGAQAVELHGDRAMMIQVQLELCREVNYSGIHFAGHADVEAGGQVALLLARRSRLYADSVRALLRGCPFVFLNACGTDSGSARGRRSALTWQAAEGLAAACIGGGARSVVATSWEVDDEGAAVFAELFYAGALAGFTIGEALRQARQRFRQERPNDLTYAAFVLYGDPHRVLIGTPADANGHAPTETVPDIPPPVPPSAPAEPPTASADTPTAPAEPPTAPPGGEPVSPSDRADEPGTPAGVPAPKPPRPAEPPPVEPPHDQASMAGLSIADDAWRALRAAADEAARRQVSQIDTPDLVIGLLALDDGPLVASLRRQHLDVNRVREAIRAAAPRGRSSRPAAPGLTRADLMPRVRSILDLAEDAARADGRADIEARDLLLGFLSVPESGTAAFLNSIGIDLAAVRNDAENPATGAGPEASTPTRRPTPHLDALGRDLTAAAREKTLKPVIGRRDEMQRVAEILARTDKNNPLLLGDAGVGKTAIVEGLAQRIAENRVPPSLRGARIVELPVSQLVAGTRFRGDLEERLTRVLDEASQAGIILFIDEAHTILGAGQGAGALDLANIIKPALARGTIRCIAATTYAEYRLSIERDPALDRRFQQVPVDEPNRDEALEILRQTRRRYEDHHGVVLDDAALDAAVRLSTQYLPDRRLPDKAADLVDQACARGVMKAMGSWSSPMLGKLPRPTIGPDLIAEILAERTGIPVGRLTEAEHERLTRLEELLGARIVGQDEAISAVARAVRLGRTGLTAPNRPVGVFLFVGPTGVGKTQLAKSLAEVLFHDAEASFVRIDMSEYMEPHNVARLIGSPPGYVGYGDEGQLTGALRRHPYSVVLFDEIEKAHPVVFDIFLQLFDDGRLTDGHGRVADGSNAIFIMTSNLAAEAFARRQRLGFQGGASAEPADVKQMVDAELRKTFRPEFLNRIQEILIFNRLSADQIRSIARRQLDDLDRVLREQHGMSLEVTDAALDLLCARGFSDEHGARPLERTIDRLIKEPLSARILSRERGRLRLDAAGETLRLDPVS